MGVTGLTGAAGPPADHDGQAAARRRTVRTAAIAAFGKIPDALGVARIDGPRSSNWQVLAQPGFSWYFFGSVVSNFGTWLQNTAQVVLARCRSRSEEHTSELQSRVDLVCRLLLEKKKKKKKRAKHRKTHDGNVHHLLMQRAQR